MLTKQLDIMAPYRPLPISYLIQTARDFSCTILIQSVSTTIDVKDYDAMQKDFEPDGKRLIFYLSGCDEREAERKISRIFQV
ncbi:HPr family phosphocarrier protein [Clostridium sp. AM58-1XD]|uniref:HPr family phosphocarrier protein n=1 Tax=Clostridium sp. AM58-1XD TaxID=2292307 RepID=UPI000E468E56|nr:HPr family phosphocarrier protein [Clostridium sp. AM58-1XD]RGY97728.1 HPr family phosphocarrier protein [Clostridium sp. AM58-1XD]